MAQSLGQGLIACMLAHLASTWQQLAVCCPLANASI